MALTYTVSNQFHYPQVFLLNELYSPFGNLHSYPKPRAEVSFFNLKLSMKHLNHSIAYANILTNSIYAKFLYTFFCKILKFLFQFLLLGYMRLWCFLFVALL